MRLRVWIVFISRYAALTLVLPCLTPTAVQAQDDSGFHLPRGSGPHAVGFKVVEQYDRSRTYRHATDALGRPYQGERARPIQTLVWYPAERSSAARMTFGDYMSLWATQTSFEHPKLQSRAQDVLAAVGPTLKTPLLAIRNARATTGHFPVVIYAPGYQEMAWNNADLCEYLASFGYVVIGIPSLGVATQDNTMDLAGLRVQAQDISFLIGYAQTLPDTDISEVAVVGQSWGGFSNLFAAARDSRIGALVTLDGSLKYFPGLLTHVDDVHPDEMTIPLLAFIQRELPLESQMHITDAQRDGPNVLGEWTHGDLVTVHMLGLSHAAFTSLSQRREDWWWALDHVWPTRQGDYGREDAMQGYGWMAHYTLRFLDAYLKHDAAARAFLENAPARNGVPPHVMAVSYRAASGEPTSFEALRAEVGRRGFDRLDTVYEDFQKRRPDFKPAEALLADWADELISDNDWPEALAVLKLTVQLYPDSTAARALLGDAYRREGQKQLALSSYQEALDKDPANGFVRWKLEDLGSTGPRSERVVAVP